ncbi:MAG: GTP-binding protein [Candidatus Kariarchaeaceae archaeon]|jgi:small GTP-binding protein
MVGSDIVLHKIAVLGTPRAGKTTLAVKLAKGIVDSEIMSTRGVDFHVVSAEKEGIKLQVWDYAGQGHYADAGIFDDMVMGASAFLFCYDAADPGSMKEIDRWIEIAQHHRRFSDTKKYLIGLKADLVDNPGQMMGLNSLVSKHLDQPELVEKHFIVSTLNDINLDILIGELLDDLKTIV